MSDSAFKAFPSIHERRKNPRICVPFHITLSGLNEEGQRFMVETVLDNVSSDGLYMRMMPKVVEGTRLAVEIALENSVDAAGKGKRILVEGVVVRAESKAGGASGIAVAFERVRFA